MALTLVCSRETVASSFSLKVLGAKMVFKKMTIETTVFLNNSTAGLIAGYAETPKKGHKEIPVS